MKPFEFFNEHWAHNERLKTQYNRGHLRIETIDTVTTQNLVEQIIAPGPLTGFYLEIGPAGSPYFVGSSRPFSGQVQYLGVDGGQSRYIHSGNSGWGEYDSRYGFMRHAKHSINEQSNSSYAHLLWGDAQQLPLPDHSSNQEMPIRETFMRDVFLDAGVHPQSIDRIIKEQSRVLAPEGLLIIRETTFTGYFDEQGGIGPRFLHLISSIERAGFTRRAMVIGTTPGFRELLAVFPGGDDNEIMPIGYYLICQKGEVQQMARKKWNKNY